MDKVKAFLSSKFLVSLYRIVGYAVVEVLASQALINLLEVQIPDEYVYGIVIVVVVQLRTALKELLGDNKVVKIL